MRFIKDTDYTTLLRDEIKAILMEDYSASKMLMAEQMAIAQIKNYLHGYYNTDAIFAAHENINEPDNRNAHIVMITLDCAIYHLYTSLAPDKIPSHRTERYEDVIKWLRDVGRGHAEADLPKKTDTRGNALTDIIIKSQHSNENNRW